VPLQQRVVRGQLEQSRAELEAKRQEQQLAADQIELEVRNILQELTAARELLELAEQEVTQSSIMRQSEVTRFQSGASDFFLVNIREETEANARVRMMQAKLATLVARANFDAATVDLERLGIRESMVPATAN
jgi:outer membrane protein TolC